MDQQSPRSSLHAESIRQSKHSSRGPRTPKPPFSPPRRRSSLAFSSIAKRASQGQDLLQDAPLESNAGQNAATRKSNISRKRALASPATRDRPSPGHVAQMQKIFQVAKTNLHLDMHVASSPAGSIISRMVMDEPQFDCLKAADGSGDGTTLERSINPANKGWRYSTIPDVLTSLSHDVREPLPSPTLPDLPTEQFGTIVDVFEPVSSGFTSPSAVPNVGRDPEEPTLPPLPDSTPPPKDEHCHQELRDCQISEDTRVHSSTKLERTLTQLKVTCDHDSEDSAMEESPIVTFLKRRSENRNSGFETCPSPEHKIYLSESAEAAAESAKAKRRLLRENFHERDDISDINAQEFGSSNPSMHEKSIISCPDPTIHHISHTTLCPDPAAHYRAYTPPIYANPMLMRSLGGSTMPSRREFGIPPRSSPNLQPGFSRATATGSPMPFTRMRSRPTSPNMPLNNLAYQPPLNPHLTIPVHSDRNIRAPLSLVNEHFQPGWYYARDSTRNAVPPMYSFSTAASKVVGSNQAPDSRIRDSYKTDTLTALAKPPNRFRKNGIGATMSVRGVGRYYGGPSSRQRPATSGARPMSRSTVRTADNVHFRSSPPRSADYYGADYTKKQRIVDNDNQFAIFDDKSARGADFKHKLNLDDDITDIDEDSGAAVRLSMLEKNLPDALQRDRQGIRELSPNVTVLRKGMQGANEIKRQRRPSYWDDDLKEVRDSPAGRGGVYSPVSAQQSMRAEFEEASMRSEDVMLNENDLVCEVAKAGEELERRLGGLPLSTEEESTPICNQREEHQSVADHDQNVCGVQVGEK